MKKEISRIGVNTLRERTRWALNYVADKNGKYKLSNAKLGDMMNIATSTINSYRRMKTDPNIEFILKFCELFKFSLIWFVEGIGYPYPGAWDDHPESRGPKEFSSEDITSNISEKQKDPGDYIFIPQISDRISAGTGVTPYNTTNMKVAFRKDWVNRKGDPKNMSLIKVMGDSMEPTLIAGDLVLVDHGRTRVDAQGGIYAISIDHEIMIKRIQVLYPEGKLKIISDNDRYEPSVANDEEVKINGKVIWFGRELER